VAKRENVIDVALLEHSIREDLNKHARRIMGVLRPLKVVIDNYPDNQVVELDAINNPEDPSMGTRKIIFSKHIFIEKDDFKEIPPKKYYRLSPGNEVRLRYGYIIKCIGVVKDSSGEAVEVHCTYDPETKSGSEQSHRKVKGTIHWVSADYNISAEVRLYDRLFNSEDPGAKGRDFREDLNPDSLDIIKDCKIENSVKDSKQGDRFQFERLGYFCVDIHSDENLIFNRTVALRDSWAKIENKM